MKTMKALRFEKYGRPSVLSVEELPVPELKPGEALIELHASAINPSDVKNVAGVFRASLPRIPGRDFAGLVVAGDGWKGREVWGSGAGFGVWRDSTHAQYIVVSSDGLSEKPADLSMEEASTVGVPYLAALSGLVEAARYPGRRDGLDHRRPGRGRQGGHADRTLEEGESHRGGYLRQAQRCRCFVNTKTQDLPAEVKAMTDGKGADLVFNAVGGPMFEPCLKSLRVGGRQVAITSVGNRRVKVGGDEAARSRPLDSHTTPRQGETATDCLKRISPTNRRYH
jgi:NADPH:quinone reductase